MPGFAAFFIPPVFAERIDLVLFNLSEVLAGLFFGNLLPVCFQISIQFIQRDVAQDVEMTCSVSSRTFT